MPTNQNKSITWTRVAGKEVPANQVLPRMPTNQIRALPVHALSARKFARVTGEKIDFYHRGN